MDMVKMGSFLAELRKEHELTQAELGEKLGVTNKTVSRWETGNYMPPVEMLEELSNFYGLTINELLSGRKLSTEEFKEMAETNIKETLDSSVFSLKDKQEFFKKKWLKDHIALMVVFVVAWLFLVITLSIKGIEVYLVGAIGGFIAMLMYEMLHNQMMIYVENNIYGRIK
ncbi:MAG: helix-turn-helix domain-containing protein [Lachnospiraceae bacterium]|nr:helix-turn-helix domain-containing protein [Lachnospiraceae bacterium]